MALIGTLGLKEIGVGKGRFRNFRKLPGKALYPGEGLHFREHKGCVTKEFNRKVFPGIEGVGFQGGGPKGRKGLKMGGVLRLGLEVPKREEIPRNFQRKRF